MVCQLKLRCPYCKTECHHNYPLQIVRGEDCLLGVISKVSGIATASRQAVILAGKVQVVAAVGRRSLGK